MKKITLLFFILIATLFFTLPQKSFAFSGLFEPFAGKVITSFSPGVTCAGEGPIIIKPVTKSPASFYAVTPSTTRYLYKTITPGSLVVGLYLPTLSPICTTWSGVPFFAFPIIMFGSSLL